MKDLNDIHHRSGVVSDLVQILSEHLTETRLDDAAKRLGASITLISLIEAEAKKLDAEIGDLLEGDKEAA